MNSVAVLVTSPIADGSDVSVAIDLEARSLHRDLTISAESADRLLNISSGCEKSTDFCVSSKIFFVCLSIVVVSEN